MANVSILGGNVTVYFTNDPAGDKEIRWTGSQANTATHTVNELYSAIQDLFDNVTGGAGDYMNEGTPMFAVTPTEYRVGRIENNDPEPWFISQETTEHLTGGSIQTTGWTRITGTDTGIVCIAVTGSTLDVSDIGSTITHADGDSGKLIDIESSTFICVRPDDATAANNFDSTTGTLTCNSNTATQNGASGTGESFWTNVKTVGTLFDSANTTIYIAQNGTVIPTYWSNGPVDRLIRVRQQSATSIDDGYLTIYAREENELYDNFVTQVVGGGTVTVPITTGNDLNDATAIVTGVSVNIAGPYSADVDPDIGSPNENYSIQINCGGQPLSNVYSYVKQLTQEANSTVLAGVQGQQYIGADHQIDYATETNTVNIGDRVTGSVSGATGYVLNKNTTYVMLANSQGEFSAGENLVIGAASLNSISNINVFPPTKQSPFGTFAGGRFFGSRGVYLTNVGPGDNNNYQTIDDDGNIIEEELQVSYALTNVLANTEVRIYTYTDVNDPSTYTEIAGINDVGGPADGNDNNLNVGGSGPYSVTYTYVYSSNTGIVTVAFNTGFGPVRRLDTLTAEDQSIQIFQISDRQYF